MNRLLPEVVWNCKANGSSQRHKMYQSWCTAKNSWWWAERLPETCRVVIPIKLEFSASVGFIHKESVTMHGHTIVNNRTGLWNALLHKICRTLFQNRSSDAAVVVNPDVQEPPTDGIVLKNVRTWAILQWAHQLYRERLVTAIRLKVTVLRSVTLCRWLSGSRL